MKYWYVIKTFIRFVLIKIFRTPNFKFGILNLVLPLSVFDLARSAKVEFGNHISMRRNVQIGVRKNGNLKIGKNCFFNSNCLITCHSKIIIGETCQFGPGVMMFDHDHNMKDSSAVLDNKAFTTDEITIGDGCWFGAGCIVLKGTHIGNHCVFGAGTIIKGDYEDNSIVVQKRSNTIKHWN